MTDSAHFLKSNVFCRCGQAVSRLAESGLIERPELASSETEIKEWWLVSAELADRLRTAGMPVVRFAELHLWGRSAAAVPWEDDLELIAAITAGAGGRSGATPAAGGHP